MQSSCTFLVCTVGSGCVLLSSYKRLIDVVVGIVGDQEGSVRVRALVVHEDRDVGG